MGRITKNTVDYFPHFVDNGKTKFILQNRFGNDGYAFWFKLLEMLCKADGHYIDCRNASQWEFLLAEMRLSPDITEKLLYLLVEIEQIDKTLWDSRVIWCQNLVNNLATIYQNRKRPLPQKPIITVEMTAQPDNYSRNATDAPISTAKSTQSILKDSDSKKNNFSPLPPADIEDTETTKKKINFTKVKMGTISAYLRMEITSLIREHLQVNPVGSISMDLENRLRNDIEFAGKGDFAKGKNWFELWIVERYCPFILQMRDKRNQEGKPPGYYPSFAGMVEQFEKDMADKQLNTIKKQRKKDNQEGSNSLKAETLIKQCLGKDLPETLEERRFCNDIMESFSLLSAKKIDELFLEKAISPNETNRSKVLWRKYLEEEPKFEPF